MNDLTKISKTPRWFKAILLLGMLLFACYASTHMVAAGDTWVAMACGRHFANHGVDTVDPFSFNSHKAGPSDEKLSEAGWPEWTHGTIRKLHPTGWINQNWLTHLIFYKLATWFGDGDDYNFNTLVYWKFALYFITVLLVFAIGKVLGVPNLLAAAAACLAMVVGRTFYDIRPAGYSNMLVPAFILILALTMCKNYRLVWLIVPVIVFWANVHGGYIYAFIMLVPFIGINLLLRLPKRWALCLGFCGLWLVLYLMSYKFITGYKSMIDHFYSQIQTVYNLSQADLIRSIEVAAEKVFGYDPDTISLVSNKMFMIWVILAIISVVLTSLRQINSGVFYFFHIFAGGVYFLSLLPRFLVGTPDNLPAYFPSFATSSLLSFLFVCIAGTLLILAMAFKKEAFVSLPVRGLYHTIGASAVALVAMIIFNPFHLTNLTHTFEISVSKHAESWRQVNEWKPAFDFMDKMTTMPNPVGKEGWFGVMCVLTLVVFVTWLIAYFLKPRLTSNKKIAKASVSSESGVPYSWPKINLALIVLSFLTIYLAIRSRRFIAIAGAAACPIIAMLLFQAWQMVVAKIQFNQTDRLTTRAIGRWIVRGAVTLAIFGLAVFWGLKYKRIYLDPWPINPKYDSLFMRMTASHLKPIEACQFIKTNNLSGKVFNYWTEGGAVALGQQPNPETGEIPLKLFMDGRAQAAYNHDKFRLWQKISAGGAGGQKATQTANEMKKLERKGNRNSSEYRELHKLFNENITQSGSWIDKQLQKYGVWVILMPMSQEDSTFMQAMRTSELWKTAYIDDIQHMLVNTQTSQGAALITQILEGKALFPTDYTKDLTLFSVITENRDTDRYADLYTLAKDAFALNPSPAAAVMLLKLQGSQNRHKDIVHYLNDFSEKGDIYKNEAGYLQRLNTASICARFLGSRIPEERQKYETLGLQFKQELKAIERRQIW